MAWNQPGDNGQDRDPWGSSNKGGEPTGKKQNRGKKSSATADDLFKAINRFLGGVKKGGNGGKVNMPINSGRLIPLVVLAVIGLWGASGFYTIKEAERGVVVRLGKFSHDVGAGLNWKPTFIDRVTPVNVQTIRELAASGMMLTSDENMVRVEMNVQYRVTDPVAYLFNVANPDSSLEQATDSALRGVIGKYSMDKILTEGRTIVRNDTQLALEETIAPYNMGITLQDVNFQVARAPEEVKAAFDDAIAARENEQQFIREAEAYANEVQPRANGQAQRLIEDAKAYKDRSILEAQGEVARFEKILPEYKKAPKLTRERLHIETMEKVLGNTRKVIVNDKGNKMMVLPMNQTMQIPGVLPAQQQPLQQNIPTASQPTNVVEVPAERTFSQANQGNNLSTLRGDVVRVGRQ